MRAVVFTGSGGREVVAVMERPEVEPAGEEVLVAVRYAGLNPADLAQRAGSYPAPAGVPSDIPGIEVAGTVVACGPAATEHPPGTRVFGIVGGGGLAERVLVHQRHVTRVPEALDEQAAAAVPEVFVTAHDAICTQGKVGLGDVLVVNGANGGVGTAAVQIGLAAGARVIATVRSPELRERDDQMKTLVVGVELVEKDLLAAFEKHGVKRIAPLGEPFNHEYHQAMYEVENTGHPSGTVVELLQPGYVLHDRLLRPAMVVVAKDGTPGAHGRVDTTA